MHVADPSEFVQAVTANPTMDLEPEDAELQVIDCIYVVNDSDPFGAGCARILNGNGIEAQPRFNHFKTITRLLTVHAFVASVTRVAADGTRHSSSSRTSSQYYSER